LEDGSIIFWRREGLEDCDILPLLWTVRAAERGAGGRGEDVASSRRRILSERQVGGCHSPHTPLSKQRRGEEVGGREAPAEARRTVTSLHSSLKREEGRGFGRMVFRHNDIARIAWRTLTSLHSSRTSPLEPQSRSGKLLALGSSEVPMEPTAKKTRERVEEPPPHKD